MQEELLTSGLFRTVSSVAKVKSASLFAVGNCKWMKGKERGEGEGKRVGGQGLSQAESSFCDVHAIVYAIKLLTVGQH